MTSAHQTATTLDIPGMGFVNQVLSARATSNTDPALWDLHVNDVTPTQGNYQVPVTHALVNAGRFSDFTYVPVSETWYVFEEPSGVWVGTTLSESGVMSRIAADVSDVSTYWADLHAATAKERDETLQGIEAESGQPCKATTPKGILTFVRNNATAEVFDTFKSLNAKYIKALNNMRIWKSMQSHSALMGVIQLAMSMPEVCARAEDFDADQWAINTAGGYLKIDNGVAHTTPSAREHRTTTRVKATYRADIDPLENDDVRSLLGAVDPQHLEFFQRVLGAAITGEHTPFATFLYGHGSNGKSLVLGVAQSLLGDVASALHSTVLHGSDETHPAAQYALKGLRLAYQEETDSGWVHMESLKRVVDSQTIAARPLYGAPTTFSPTHTLIVNTNEPLKYKGNSGAAERRRVEVVEFPYQYVTESAYESARREGHDMRTLKVMDAELKYRLLSNEESRDAFFTWMVQGALLNSVQPIRLAPRPSDTSQVTSDWSASNDPVVQFFDEYLKVGEDDDVMVLTDLFTAFKQYCDRYQYKQLNVETFRERLIKVMSTKGVTSRRCVTSRTYQRKSHTDVYVPFSHEDFYLDTTSKRNAETKRLSWVTGIRCAE